MLSDSLLIRILLRAQTSLVEQWCRLRSIFVVERHVTSQIPLIQRHYTHSSKSPTNFKTKITQIIDVTKKRSISLFDQNYQKKCSIICYFIKENIAHTRQIFLKTINGHFLVINA